MLKVDIHKTLKSKSREYKLAFEGNFKKGEITTIYGRSGLGKTTILRIIAGLEKADTGLIHYEGVAWFDETEALPLVERPVSIVFQDFNLFENMTIQKNLAYASNGKIPNDIQQLVQELQLSALLQNKPFELSKGQQQKVAILRSLCTQAEILLLDEPFSALDDESILEIMNILRELRSTHQMTIVLVTHRRDVILELADSVVHMGLKQQGEPSEMIERLF